MLRPSFLVTFALGAAAMAGGCSSSSSSNSDPPCWCPAIALGVNLAVNSESDGGAVFGVQATLSGPATVTMDCKLDFGRTRCSWPSGASVTPGSYTLQVAALGFRTASVPATVTIPKVSCCPIASMTPASVTLDPSPDVQDGGADGEGQDGSHD